jgi:uncharacterized delta-60 repeat protein
VVVGGVGGGRDERLVVVQVGIGGHVDPSFGSGGELVGPVDSIAQSVTVQRDGKVLVLGSLSGVTSVLRLESNGATDPRFGHHGVVALRYVTGGFPGTDQILVQRNGKILISGLTGSPPRRVPFVARLDPNGSPDRTFGRDGVATIRASNTSGYVGDVVPLALAPHGDIVVGTPAENLVARLTSSGHLDRSFAENGILHLDPGEVSSVAVQRDGKILIGEIQVPSGRGALLTRLNRTGTPDRTFGIDGSVIAGHGPDHINSATSIAIQPNGAIVFSGEGPIVARVNPNGSPDQSFGSHGAALLPLGQNPGVEHEQPETTVTRLLLLSDGNIFAAGETTSAGPAGANVILARLIGSRP